MGRYTDFYNRIRYEVRDGELIELKVPTDSSLALHREWLLISLRTDWQVGDVTYPAGALLGTKFDDFLDGTAHLAMIYEPDEHTSLSSVQWTKEKLILITLRDVASHVEVVTRDVGAPGRPGYPPATDTVVVDIDPFGDEVFYNSSGFTTRRGCCTARPAATGRGQVRTGVLRRRRHRCRAVLRHLEGRHEGSVLRGRAARRTEPDATCYGYGGFQNSLTPGYIGGIGRAWLERGGTYVQANIRGGGEYGPRWHKQAMRENRHLVYEDFAAIAADLVRRGITTVEQLGAAGGSNGGLLMGVMLTRYPELFGALVCSVPLLDMKRFHLLLAGASLGGRVRQSRRSGGLGVHVEILAVSEYFGLGQYPPILITTSTRDDRVHPGHARKITAALEAAGHRCCIYENIEGGHGGAAGQQAGRVQGSADL